MDSFMSWIGGKNALRKKIIEQFPELGTYNRYIEVFGGAGWILFSSDSHAKMEVYNDVNGNLVNLFRCIKYHPDAVQEELRYILISREQFFDTREQLETRGMTDIQRAARFFILIKESFGTDLRSFGLRSRDMEKAKEYLSDKKDALFYLDPPYYKTEKYYPDKFMPEDHVRLKEALDVIKGKFVLSYNDCEYIRKLYKGYHIIEVERLHNLVMKERKPKYKELIIKNY